MIDPVNELKIRATLLHRGITAGRTEAIARLRALAELRLAKADDLAAFASHVQRKHCLAVVARELAFQSWTHAVRVLAGDLAEPDFGGALYVNARGTAGFVNPWFVVYDEARAYREEKGGYLLAYKRHFVVVERDYIATLGLDPDDADWAALGCDWARPKSMAARRSLYGKLLVSGAQAAA